MTQTRENIKDWTGHKLLYWSFDPRERNYMQMRAFMYS